MKNILPPLIHVMAVNAELVDGYTDEELQDVFSDFLPFSDCVFHVLRFKNPYWYNAVNKTSEFPINENLCWELCRLHDQLEEGVAACDTALEGDEFPLRGRQAWFFEHQEGTDYLGLGHTVDDIPDHDAAPMYMQWQTWRMAPKEGGSDPDWTLELSDKQCTDLSSLLADCWRMSNLKRTIAEFTTLAADDIDPYANAIADGTADPASITVDEMVLMPTVAKQFKKAGITTAAQLAALTPHNFIQGATGKVRGVAQGRLDEVRFALALAGLQLQNDREPFEGPDADPELNRNVMLSDLPLQRYVRAFVDERKVITLGGLASLDVDELWETPAVGPATVEFLEKLLKAYGMHFRNVS